MVPRMQQKRRQTLAAIRAIRRNWEGTADPYDEEPPVGPSLDDGGHWLTNGSDQVGSAIEDGFGLMALAGDQ